MNLDELQNLVNDEAIEKAWGNANFGDTPKRQVIADTLLKCASGYHSGSFSMSVTNELGLTSSKKWELTKKGKLYLYEAFKNKVTEFQ